MISEEKIYENKIRFIELLTKLDIDLTSLTKYLDCDRVNYFNKPYNNYPDYAYAGSLCERSLKLYDELVKLANLYYPNTYSEKDLIIVALFKDLYRAELYEAYNKNVKNDLTGTWETQVAYRTKEIRPIFGDANFSSYMITRKFINLDNDELVEALCYSGNNSNIEIHNIRKDYKLVVLLTIAELAVSYLGGEEC